MLEYTPLNHKGVKLGNDVPLGKGESASVKIIARSGRTDLFTVDASGAVSCNVTRDMYLVEADPPEVRRFNGEVVKISDLLAPGQRVRYRRVVAPDRAKKLNDTDITGVEVYRRPLPAPVAESES